MMHESCAMDHMLHVGVSILSYYGQHHAAQADVRHHAEHPNRMLRYFISCISQEMHEATGLQTG